MCHINFYLLCDFKKADDDDIRYRILFNPVFTVGSKMFLVEDARMLNVEYFI